MNNTDSIKELVAYMKVYLEERGWDTLKPGDVSKSISIEANELLENFQWTNPTLAEVRSNPELLKQLKSELADILTYCLDMAVLLDIDVEHIIREKVEKVKEKYPAELMKNESENSYPGSENYWRIKKEHRAKDL